MKQAKTFFYWIAVGVLLMGLFVGCSYDEEEQEPMEEQRRSRSTRFVGENELPQSDTVVLGRKLPIPQEISNMRRAARALIDKGVLSENFANIQPTHYYVRFTPLDSADMDELYFFPDSNLILFPYRLDYEVLTSGGSFFREAGLPEDQPNPQYSVVPVGMTLPNVRYEIIAEVFLEDDDEEDGSSNRTARSRSGISEMDYWKIEQKVFEILGLEFDIPNPMLRSSKWAPKGRIQVRDRSLNQDLPVAGVEVKVWNGLRVRKVRTNADGYFAAPKDFKGSNASYRIKWESVNERFDIRSGGFGQAFTDGPSDLKKGKDWEVTFNGGVNGFWATIFRAGWFYLNNDFGFGGKPFNRISVKAWHDEKSPENVNAQYNNGSENIKIWGKGNNGVRFSDIEIFSFSAHEFAHAHHDEIFTGGSVYRNTKERLRESWAEAVEHFMTLRAYGNSNATTVKDWIKRTNKQDWTNQHSSLSYTPFVIDLIDDFDQNELIDRVSGFTLKQVADALAKSGTKDLAELVSELKKLKNPLAKDEDLHILLAEMERGGYKHSVEKRMLGFHERDMWRRMATNFSVTAMDTNTTYSYLNLRANSNVSNMTITGNHPIKSVRGQNWARVGVRVNLSMPENTPWIQAWHYAGNLQLSVGNSPSSPFNWMGQFDINKTGGYVQDGKYFVQYEMLLPDWAAQRFKQDEAYLRLMFSANPRAEFNLHKIEFFNANADGSNVLNLTAEQRRNAISYREFISNTQNHTLGGVYGNGGIVVYQTVNGVRHFYRAGQDVNDKMSLVEMWAVNPAYEPGHSNGFWRQCWIYLGREGV